MSKIWLNYLIIFITLLLSHLTEPTLAEAPIATEVQQIRQELRRLHQLELYAIRNGLEVDLSGKVWVCK